VYLGYVDVKSTDSDTLNTGGLVWVYNGTQIARSTTEWKGTMGGIGGIIPVTEKYGFRLDGGLTSTRATYTREDGASASGSGTGGRFTGTMYYNVAEGWNVQLGGRYEYLNGGNAGSKYRSGVFAMLGYSFK
jgi:hypothetical protein